MRLMINSDACAKEQFSINEVLILYLIMHDRDFNSTIRDLRGRGVLQEQNGKLVVSEVSVRKLNKVLFDSGNIDKGRLDELAIKLQKCFPEGKPQGSVSYYRSNKREIIFKLQKFFLQYGDYPDEDIIKVTHDYVKSFRGNYRYLPVITNYILKPVKTLDEFGNPVTEETSQLATQLENKHDSETTLPADDSSWLYTDRN